MESAPKRPRLSTSPSRYSGALQIQKPAPFFEGIAVFKKEFIKININDYKGRYLILFFYPLDFTFVCPTELIAFSERMEEFRKLDCAVVGCSTDSQYAHLAWTNVDRKTGGIGDLNYPLLSDKTMSIARSYGVLDEETGAPFRGLFIIDKDQRLRQIIVNDLPIGRSVDEVVRLVQALQSHEVNGQVCPINWKPGNRTIVPEPKAALEFFKTTS
ncbi:peroxiredoxin 1-like isoform X2 [Bradysia coprophila]|uniref:peroxiredoxin 1-like isoform X2 n=1 Tax=Bradysia coprophila TaxID=38358 RepID=UPI00187DD6A0|nr:peroxiredoxin 1-like isoform X2 [Bradysia coprophila]